MAQGYWQIPMAESAIEKTAFISPGGGLWEFTRMPFGLVCAGSTFQRYMDAVMAGLKWRSLLCYVDDIIVFSPNYDQHLLDLREVFTRLRHANLRLNDKKCEIFKNKVHYLGHIVSVEGIEADPVKIKAILNMKTPESASEVHSLIGGCGYYRKFIPKFAQMCQPLYKLIHYDTKFRWSEEEERAFKEIKNALTNAPILRHPNFNYPFQIHTDACDAGLGATLVQTIDGVERVILFISRTLQPAERKWSTREKEALGILWACETLRPFVINYHFEVISDHQSLKWLLEAKTPARLVRWALRLSEFDFEIKYKPGKQNLDADMLSRLPDNKPIIQTDGDDDHPYLCYNIKNKSNYQIPETTTEEIIEAQRADPVLRSLMTNEDNLKLLGLSFIDKILYKVMGKMVLLMVPQCLQTRVLDQYHTHVVSVHAARDRLWEIIKNRFYWDGIYEYVRTYVRNCETCQKIKTRAPVRAGLLQPIKSNRPFQIVGIDIAIMRISSNKSKYILVCIDYFTNWVEAAAMKSMTAEETLRVFFSLIISRHGCPEYIRSDSGTQFLSGAVTNLCQVFNIRKEESTAYHQQANGKVERFISFLKQALALITPQDKLYKWDEMIEHCLFVYRISVSRMLQDNPFYLLYGRDAILPQDLAFNLTNVNLRKVEAKKKENYQYALVKKLKEEYDQLLKHKEGEQDKYKAYYDKSHHDVSFEIGEKVLVLFDVASKGPLSPRWEGPYTILNKLDAVTYRVQNDNRNFAVHVNRLVRFNENK